MNKNKKQPKFNNLNWTFLISGVLLIASLSIVFSYHEHLFKGGDLTAQIRNVVLAVLALSGIPFLIFGHINRQNDIEIKRSDSLFKSESAITDKVYRNLEESIEAFLKDAHSVEVGGGVFDNGKVKKNLHDWMQGMVYSNQDYPTKKFEFNCLSQIAPQTFWPHMKLTISSIYSSLSMINEISNSKLKKLLLHRFSSGLSENEMVLLYFLTVLSEYDSQIIDFSYKIETLNNIYENLTNLDIKQESLISAITKIDRKIEKDGEFKY
jgi:hypothetical protein